MKPNKKGILVSFEVHEEEYYLLKIAKLDAYTEYRKALDAVPKFFNIYDYAFGTLALAKLGYVLLSPKEYAKLDKKSIAYTVRYFHDNGGDTIVMFQDKEGEWYEENGYENAWRPFTIKTYDEIAAGTFVTKEEEDDEDEE